MKTLEESASVLSVLGFCSTGKTVLASNLSRGAKMASRVSNMHMLVLMHLKVNKTDSWAVMQMVVPRQH